MRTMLGLLALSIAVFTCAVLTSPMAQHIAPIPALDQDGIPPYIQFDIEDCR